VKEKSGKYQAVVVGVSTGGMDALEKILPFFERGNPVSVLIVQHLAPDRMNYFVEHFKSRCHLPVKEGMDKQRIEPGHIYFAPPNYHMLVENGKTLALSIEAKVNYSRPSVDLLFETAAQVYGDSLVGVVLTGANSDGSHGLKKIKQLGGLTVVQNPETAKADCMPRAALAATEIDRLLPLGEIGPFLAALHYDGEV